MSQHKIPQMFYLRKFWITVHVAAGKKVMRMMKPVHIYWSYRDPTVRIIETDKRELAKEAIITGFLPGKTKKENPRWVCDPCPDADFWRH